MPKKKTPELDPKEQFKRFQEAAKELGVSENTSKVEGAFRDLAKGSDQSGRSRRSSSKQHS